VKASWSPVLVGMLVAGALAGPPWPVATFSWRPETAPKGEHSPALVAFRKGHALKFEHVRQSRLSLGKRLDAFPEFKGHPLTIDVVVQLTRPPAGKTAIVSKWHTVAGGRSFEVGLHPTRELFFSISSSGSYDKGAREFKTDVKLRVGKPYHLVAVYDPGKRMALYVNGHLAGQVRGRVPRSIHANATPIVIGNRFASERACGFDGLVASVALIGHAFDAKWAKARAQELKMTEPPEPPYPDQELPPVRAITKGPKFHWFGYYDKLQFDPTCRYALGMEADFEHRSPTAADVIKVGMVDLQDGDAWTELGESRAWCWQQGCMLQWRPGSKTEVLWNDRQDGRFVCHILDVVTRKKRTIPHPVYTVSPDGRTAFAPDFRRVQDMRPGYGYPGLPDPHKDELAPADAGIWRTDLDTGESTLIVSLADVAKIPYEHGDLSPMKHYFNHLLVNTDGTRLEFLHRWRGVGVRSFGTRMFTCNPDGSGLYVLDPHGRTSHFIWRDPTHICAWSWHPKLGNGFILYTDKTRDVELVGKGVMTGNGHNTYLPNTEWILNDTYPDGRRNQNPYLFHVPTGKQYWLGHFHSPKEYSGEWRCDTHPRFSPDGKLVCIDGVHGGNGRQLYLINISEIVGTAKK